MTHPLRPALTIVFTAGLLGGTATAFEGPSPEARGAMGVGTMLSSAQRDQGFRTGFVPDLHPGLRISDMFVVELALASWFFPRDQGTGRATMLGGGMRFDPRLTGWLSWFVDGHAGVALTGADNRFMVDGGTGFEVWLKPGLAVGPFARYGHLMDAGSDPRFWAAGVSATVTWAAASDEPPNLGGSDPDRDQRQRDWERERGSGRLSARSRDRDGDGVLNEHDICPDERPGANADPNNLGCPLENKDRNRASASDGGDRDGDGVPDKDDKCPSRSFGNFPDPMAMGCPLSDRDRDGVPDINDACPTRAGVAGKADGCPGSSGGLANVERGMIVVNHPIAFSSNRDDLLPGSVSVLQGVAGLLRATPAIKMVSIEGHTDSSLTSLQSLELSERRAESVRRWLVSNGVEPDRVRVRGLGDTQPIASNRTAKGRSSNARIEFLIIDPPGGAGL